jgi:hypothetical protein
VADVWLFIEAGNKHSKLSFFFLFNIVIFIEIIMDNMLTGILLQQLWLCTGKIPPEFGALQLWIKL